MRIGYLPVAVPNPIDRPKQLRARAERALRALCGCLALLVLNACSSDALFLDRWVLAVDGAAKGAVRLPAHLEAHGLPARDVVYTLTASVELPEHLRGQALDLVIPRMWARTSLTADGTPGLALRPEHAGAYRQCGPHVHRVPASVTRDGRVTLELRVLHRWTQSGWVDTLPRLVRAGVAEPAAQRSEFFNVFLAMGGTLTLLQIGFSSLFSFFLERGLRVYLWLGIQATLGASYPLFAFGFTQRLAGRYDVPFLGAALVLAFWASVRFSYELFGIQRQPRFWNALAGVGVAVSFAGFGPYHATAWAGEPESWWVVSPSYTRSPCAYARCAAAARSARHGSTLPLGSRSHSPAGTTSPCGAVLGMCGAAP